MTESLLAKLVNNYSEQAKVVFVIAFGAVAGTAAQYQKSRKAKESFGFIDFSIATFIAGFSGMIFGTSAELATELLEINSRALVYGCAGFGAFMGLTGLNELYDLLMSGLKNLLLKLTGK